MSLTKVSYSMIAGSSTNVQDFGAIGDGVNDDTAAIQAAITASSGSVYIPAGTYKVSDTINISSNTCVFGAGVGVTILSATNAFTHLVPMFKADVADFVTIEGISFLGNTDDILGAGTAIHLKEGSRNCIRSVYIENTTEAGIRLEEQSYCSVLDVEMQSPGRMSPVPGVTYFDNHGLVIYTDGTLIAPYDISIQNVRIYNAARKGFATASQTTGLYRLRFDNCYAEGCGTGGYFLANYSNNDIVDMTVTNCIAYDCDLNFYFQYVDGLSVSGCVADTGEYGLFLSEVKNACINGFVSNNSQLDGITLNNQDGGTSTNVVLSGCQANNTDLSASTGNGIAIFGLTNGIIADCVIYDATPNANWGIYIDNTSTRVVNTGCIINNIQGVGGIVGNLSSQSAGLQYETAIGSIRSEGGLALREKVLTLSNGQNDNIVLPSNSGQVIIQGPTAVYSISSIAGGIGYAGRRITIINDTAQVLTLLSSNGAASPTGNRLRLSNNSNITLQQWGCVELMYSTEVGGWVSL